MKGKGLIHIYCGDGKGKTTAGIGLLLRCVGGGGKAMLCQFLKDGTSGEVGLLKNIDGAEVYDGFKSCGFSFNMTEDEKRLEAERYSKAFERLTETVKGADLDLLVLDEVLHTVNLGYISLEALLEFLKNKPEALEVVMTGRDPKSELIEAADYVSEVKKIKHPFDKGVGARKYIEF
jgi:cob(I)alamin adenosyltransferase